MFIVLVIFFIFIKRFPFEHFLSMYFFLEKQTKINKKEGDFDVQTDSDQEYELNENDEEFVFPSN